MSISKSVIGGRFSSTEDQRGVVLLEALIAILIFSMGVLSLVGLQATMIKNSTDSKYRAEASFIAQQRIGMMWSDPGNAASYVESNTDISALLPGGTRTVYPTVSKAIAIAAPPTEFVVSVTWMLPGEPQHTYSTTVNIKP
jgi:type IV pilus assembly protein PilV